MSSTPAGPEFPRRRLPQLVLLLVAIVVVAVVWLEGGRSEGEEGGRGGTARRRGQRQSQWRAGCQAAAEIPRKRRLLDLRPRSNGVLELGSCEAYVYHDRRETVRFGSKVFFCLTYFF